MISRSANENEKDLELYRSAKDGGRITFQHGKSLVDELDKLSSPQLVKLLVIAMGPRSGRNVERQVMRDAIRRICNEHYVTLNALAKLLNRDIATLRNQYIIPMCEDGSLQKAFPEILNDCRQAYTSILQ